MQVVSVTTFTSTSPRCGQSWETFSTRSHKRAVHTWQQASRTADREQDLFLPVSESRSSVRTGLEVKEIFRFMEGFDFPSFPSNSLRSSFGVLVYGDNLSLLCGNEEKKNSQISLHQTDQNMHLRGVRIMTKGNICASERTQQSTLY